MFISKTDQKVAWLLFGLNSVTELAIIFDLRVSNKENFVGYLANCKRNKPHWNEELYQCRRIHAASEKAISTTDALAALLLSLHKTKKIEATSY